MTSLEQLPVQTKTDRVVDTGIDILRACILSKIQKFIFGDKHLSLKLKSVFWDKISDLTNVGSALGHCIYHVNVKKIYLFLMLIFPELFGTCRQK